MWIVTFIGALVGRSLIAQILIGVMVGWVALKGYGAAKEWAGYRKGFAESARQTTERTNEILVKVDQAQRRAADSDAVRELQQRNSRYCRDCEAVR